jgi:hypothetical protein
MICDDDDDDAGGDDADDDDDDDDYHHTGCGGGGGGDYQTQSVCYDMFYLILFVEYMKARDTKRTLFNLG